MGGRPIKRSPPPSPALGSPCVSSGIIDLTLDDDTTPPPAPSLGKRSVPPVNYDETYVDDDGTVHPPPDRRPKKRARARASSHTTPAPPKSKGKGKASAEAAPKTKARLPPVRKVQPPPLPEPHRAKLSELTTAHGLVSHLLWLVHTTC